MKYLTPYANAKILIDKANKIIETHFFEKIKINTDDLKKIIDKLYAIQLNIFEEEINNKNFCLNLFVVDLLTSIKLIMFQYNLIKGEIIE